MLRNCRKKPIVNFFAQSREMFPEEFLTKDAHAGKRR